ncbi:MAG: aldo/keto reductase [Cyanobacteria bacterium P01_H01_bin.15]
MSERKTRRQFLTTSLIAASGFIGCSTMRGQERSTSQLLSDSNPLASSEPTSPSLTASNPLPMPRRKLGRTEIELPVLGLGGAGRTPLSRSNQEEAAIEQIERALTFGIRYFDTAASYGPSEENLGKALPAYRQEVFLGSKTAARDYDGAWRELERSLRRLNTDYLDLWQFHHVAHESELDILFGKDGASKALEEAQAQGLVRFSGITGHHEPQVIATSLGRYPFDHILIPINAAEIHHPRPFLTDVLPLAKAKNVGVTAMKVPAYGRLFEPGVLTGMNQALGYSLSQSGVHCAIIAAANLEQLEENVTVAANFQPLNTDELKAIEQLTANAWQDNTFFRAWS